MLKKSAENKFFCARPKDSLRYAFEKVNATRLNVNVNELVRLPSALELKLTGY